MTDFSNRELAELLRSLEDLNEAEFVALRDESGVSDVLDVDSKMSDALFDVEVPDDHWNLIDGCGCEMKELEGQEEVIDAVFTSTPYFNWSTYIF